MIKPLQHYLARILCVLYCRLGEALLHFDATDSAESESADEGPLLRHSHPLNVLGELGGIQLFCASTPA
jgi:hypothetical protein